MSPNPKPGGSAETPEEIDRRERAALAKAVRIILSWPEPSRDPEEAVTESRDPEEAVTESSDSAENREGSPNKPEKNRAGSGKSRDSSPLREEAPSAESAREPGGES